MSASLQLLIETDVLAEYLIAAEGDSSLLRTALSRAVCYTTMLNAMELFRAASSPNERDAIMKMLHVVRILGFNARYAAPFADLAHEIDRTSHIRISDRETMILGMAQASKLTILTRLYYDRYRTLKSVRVWNDVAGQSATVSALVAARTTPNETVSS